MLQAPRWVVVRGVLQFVAPKLLCFGFGLELRSDLYEAHDAGARDETDQVAIVDDDETAAVSFVHLAHRIHRAALRSDLDSRIEHPHDVGDLLMRAILGGAVADLRQRQHADRALVGDHGKSAVTVLQEVLLDGVRYGRVRTQGHRIAGHDVSDPDMLEEMPDNRALIFAHRGETQEESDENQPEATHERSAEDF